MRACDKSCEMREFAVRTYEMVCRTQQAKVNANKALYTVSTSSASVCGQMCLALQGELDNSF